MKNNFSVNGAGTDGTIVFMLKKSDTDLIFCIKINLKWVIVLNAKHKTIKLREKMSEEILWLWI